MTTRHIVVSAVVFSVEIGVVASVKPPASLKRIKLWSIKVIHKIAPIFSGFTFNGLAQ